MSSFISYLNNVKLTEFGEQALYTYDVVTMGAH